MNGLNNTITNSSVVLAGSAINASNSSVGLNGLNNTITNSSVGIVGLNNTVINSSVVLAGSAINASDSSVGLNGLNNTITNSSVVLAGSAINASNSSVGLNGLNNTITNSSVGLNGLNNTSSNSSVVLAGSAINASNSSVVLAGSAINVSNSSVSLNGLNNTITNSSVGLVGLNNTSSNSSVVLASSAVNASNSSVVLASSAVNASNSSIILNSNNSTASLSSLIISGQNNIVSNNSTGLGNNNATISQSRSLVVGANNVTLNASNSLVIGGRNIEGSAAAFNLTLSGDNIVSIGGINNKLGSNSTAIGGYNNKAENSSVFIGGSGNSVGSYSNITMINVKDVTAAENNTAYLPRSFFTGNVTVNGNLSASGNVTSVETLITTEWVARLVNYLQTSAVLYADQRNSLGNYSIAEFYSMGSPKLFVTKQGVGVNTSSIPAPYVFTFNGSSSGVNLLLNDKLTFGNGDTNLYRSNTDTLQTDDNLIVSGNLNVVGNTSISGNVILGSDATDTLTFNGGPVNYPNATSTADAIVIGGDTNLYRSATDILKTDDNLNIGTLSTGTTNTVITHSGNTLQQRNINSRAWDTVATYLSGAPTHNYVVKAKGSNELINSLIFDNGTNVGINTSSPTTRLEIGDVSTGVNSTWQSGTDFLKLFANNNNFSEQAISFQETGTNVGAKIGVKNTANGAYDIIFANRINTSTTSSITEKMRITHTGNVGIGTNNPTQKLHVTDGTTSGDVRISLGTGINVLEFIRNGANDNLIRSYGGPLFIDQQSNNPLIFKTNATERMRLDANGNVGIGISTLNTSTQLTVFKSGGGNVLYLYGNGSTTTPTSIIASTYDGWSVSAPATIQFIDDLQYSNHITFRTKIGGGFGGSDLERMRISSTGNVGIGTTSPQTKLHISGASTELLRITDGTMTLYAGCDNNSPWFGTSTNNDLRLTTNATEKLRITAAGNVGIGTTSPDCLLDVGNGTGSKKLKIDGGNTNTADGAGLFIANNSVALGAFGNYSHLIGGTYNSTSTLWSANSLLFITGGGSNERMRITSTGNVGIGNASPSKRLTIEDGTTAGIHNQIYITPSSGGLGRESSILFGATFSNGWNGVDYNPRASGQISYGGFGSTTNARSLSMKFFTGNATNDTPTERMRIDSYGNVGIGTTAVLDSKLTVAGGDIQLDNNNSLRWASSNTDWAQIYFESTGDGEGLSKLILETQDNADEPIIFRQSGLDRMYIGTNGNVGIGVTPSTSYKLDVSGDSIIRGWLRTSGNNGWFNQTYNGGWFMSDTSWVRTYNEKNVWAGSGLLGANGGLTIGHGGVAPSTNGAIIKGNVGIGEVFTPGARLVIRETSAGVNPRTLLTTTWDTQIMYSTDREGVVGWSFGQDATDAHKFKISNYYNNLQINTRFSIDNNGRVGIGTTTPWTNTILDVRGGLVRIGTSNTAYGYLQLGASDITTKNWHIGVENSDDSLRIWSGTWGGNGTERLRFDSVGRSIFAAVGSASNPTVSLNPSFAGAAMGMYADGGHLRFGVAGSERLRLQNDGGIIFSGYITGYGKINAVGSEGVIGLNGGGSGGMFEQQASNSSNNSSAGNAAYMTFHRPGAYAVKFGLDTDNKLKVGGWSMGNVAYEIWHEGNAFTKADTRYVNKNGDTLTGLLNLSDSGFGSAIKNNINTQTNSGFFQIQPPYISVGWPGGFYNLISCTQNNISGYYSTQFAGDPTNSNEIYYRATNNSDSAKWNKVWHEGNSGQFIRRWAKFRNWNGCSGDGSYYRTNAFIDQLGNLYAAGYSAGYWFGKGVDGQNTLLGGGFTNITPPLDFGDSVREVYLGARSMYVLTKNGLLWGTGYNGYGQLGIGNTVQADKWWYITAGVISFATNVGATAVGCCLAIKSDGVYAWGYNIYGQLGDNTQTNVLTPKKVLSGSFTKVVTTTAEDMTSGWGCSMALRSDGVLFMTGCNNSGNFGIGVSGTTKQFYTAWTQVATNVKNCWVNNDSFPRIASFYLSNSNLLYAAGNNYHGWFGNGVFDGDNNTAKSWTAAGGGLTYTDISSFGWSGRSVIGLRPDGSVRTWGYNGQGECGDGTTTRRNTPFNIGLTNVVKVKMYGANYGMSAFLTSDGQIYMCGYNGYGQLGVGGTANSSIYQPVVINKNIKFVDFDLWGEAAGTGVTAADEQGQLWSWGYNAHYSCAQTINDNNYNNRVEMPMPCNIHGF